MDMDFALFRQVADNVGDERNVAARFYDKAVKTDKTTANGLPIFKNVTYIEIRLKDNSTEVFNQPASAEKIKRFPKEYEIYQAAKKQTENGTPLNQFAFLTAAEIATCSNRGIFTVEALAALDEDKVHTLGLENEYHLAHLFLQAAKSAGAVAEFARKEKDYLNRIEKLEDENEQLKRALEKLNKSGKSKSTKGKKDEDNS